MLYGLAANRKRSIFLDAKSADGRVHLERLMRTADVVLINRTDAAARRLRLRRPTCARSTRAILARFDAYGAPTDVGPMREYNGYDDCAGLHRDHEPLRRLPPYAGGARTSARST